MFSTILVSYDGSDHAKKALEIAASLARAYDAELHLSHTPQIDTPTIVTKDNFKTDRPNFFTPRSRTTTTTSNR